MTYRWVVTAVCGCALAVAVVFGPTSHAQVAKGVLDPNVATEAELLAVPNLNAGVVKALLARRPFMGPVEWNAFLKEQSLSPAQITEVFGKAFVHINLN